MWLKDALNCYTLCLVSNTNFNVFYLSQPKFIVMATPLRQIPNCQRAKSPNRGGLWGTDFLKLAWKC